MASNALTQNVLQASIKGFAAKATPLLPFKPISPVIPMTEGDSVVVPYVTSSVSTVFSAATGYGSADTMGFNGNSVALNIHLFQEVALTDGQYHVLSRQAIEDAFSLAGERLGSDFSSASLASVLGSFTQDAAFGGSGLSGSAGVADLTSKAINWTTHELVVAAPAYTSLLQNPQFINAYALGSSAVVQQGEVESNAIEFFGWNVWKCGHALSGSLAGFAASRQALAVVNAIYAPPSDVSIPMLEFEIARDERTGMQVGVRRYYDLNAGKYRTIVEVLGGIKAVDTSALYRLQNN